MISTESLSRRAALAALGACALAGLGGCAPTNAPAVQAGAQPTSAFHISSIAVDTAPLLAQSGNPTAQWVQQALPGQLAQAFAANMAPGDPGGATLSVRIDSLYLGQGGPADPQLDEGRGDAQRGWRRGPPDALAGDVDLYCQSGRPGAGGTSSAGSRAGAVAILRLLVEEKVAPLDKGREDRHEREGVFGETSSATSLRRRRSGRPNKFSFLPDSA